MGNLVGLDLKIDDKVIEQAVKDSVLLGISQALENKDSIVTNLVASVLNCKVDKESGKPSTYSSSITLLEFYVKKMIREEVVEEMKKIVDEKRDDIRQVLRKEITKKSFMDNLVKVFLATTLENLNSSWKTNINVEFEKKRDY